MAGQTIKEFLIGLGINVDELDLTKFEGFVSRTTKAAVALGGVATTTALAVGTLVRQVAREYENLYYLGQRSGNSVTALNQVGFAFKQIGLSADDAAQQAESFASVIRLQPGFRGFLSAFGVKQDKDNFRTLLNFVDTLKKRFGETNYFVAAGFAQQAGVAEPVFRRMWQNLDELKTKMGAFAKSQRDAGVDADGLARDSKGLGNALDSLYSKFGLVADQTTQKWVPAFITATEYADKFAGAVVRAGKDTDGWISTLATLGASLGVLRGSAWLLRLLGMSRLAGVVGLGAAGGIAGTVAGAVAAPATIAALTYAASKRPEGQNFKASGDIRTDVPRWLQAVRPVLRDWLGVEDEKGIGPKSGRHGPDSALNIVGARGQRDVFLSQRGTLFPRLIDLLQAVKDNGLKLIDVVAQGATAFGQPGSLAFQTATQFMGSMPSATSKDAKFSEPKPDPFHNDVFGVRRAQALGLPALERDGSRTVTQNNHTTINVAPGEGSTDTAKRIGDAFDDVLARGLRNMRGVVQ